ncbi:MAG: hypothetical protein ACK5Q5_17765, partial [Planctomycetaceae bacterium]
MISRLHWKLPIAAALATLVVGCNSGDVVDPGAKETVCIDTKSKEVVVVTGLTSVPETNSQTGTKTLVPAMYCDKCKTWHATPPVEQLQRQHGVAHCPKSGVALTIDGPLPPDIRRQ